MKRTGAFLCLFFAALCQQAFADQLKLKNGDRLTGTIIKADGKAVTLKTDYAGTLTVSLEAVEEIASDNPLYFALNDGKTVFGKVATRAGDYEVETKEATRVAVARAAVTAIRSPEEQAAYERMLNPSWLRLWTGVADFGYSLTTGNTRTNTITLGTNLARTTTRDKTILYAALINAKNKTKGISETTANAIRGGGRYEINLTKKLSAFGFTDLEYNEIQLLDLRAVVGGGLGYYARKTDRVQWQFFGGGAYNRENFSTRLSRNSGEILAGEDLALRLSDRVSLKERLQFFPNLTETGQYRVTFDSAVVTKLNRWLNWQVIVSDRYLSNPVLGSKKNDLLFTTGVSVNFKR